MILLKDSLSDVSEKGKTTVPASSPVIKQRSKGFILHKQVKATRQETDKTALHLESKNAVSCLDWNIEVSLVLTVPLHVSKSTVYIKLTISSIKSKAGT